MYLRALADFDNYRRRTERERASIARGGKRDLIVAHLDVIDNFDDWARQAVNPHRDSRERNDTHELTAWR